MVFKKISSLYHLTIFIQFYLIKETFPQVLFNLNFAQKSPFNVTLNWQINSIDFCGISSFLISTTRNSSSITTYDDTFSIISTTAYQNICMKSNSSRYSNFDCTFLNSELTCNLNVTDLFPNSKYLFTVKPISNLQMWQPAISPDYLTGVNIPSIVGLNVMSSLKNFIGLQLTLPSIDQTNGTITKFYLYLVDLCQSSSTNSVNFTILNDLKSFVTNTESCSNSTKCSEFCLVKNYTHFMIDFTSSITLYVVSSSNLKLMERNTTFLIENSIIKLGNNYLIFFVYEIKNTFDSSFSNVFYFSRIVTTIQVKASSPTPNDSTNNSNNYSIQDWQIILICCVLIVISLLLIGLVIAFVFRKRIKNLFRKYGGKYKPNIELIYTDEAPAKSYANKYEFNSNDIKKICLNKRANDNYIFEQEFKALPDYHNVKPSSVANDMKNAIKNRYTDIKAYDDSRVVLKNENEEVGTSEASSDYINANFVQGYYNEKKFIATQGPKSETIGDFWKMIYQNNVKIVVMLTDLIENNVIKCQRYWPINLNSTETYGTYNVTFLDERVYVDYVKRTLKLIHTKNGNKNDQEESRIIYQYFYPSWADKLWPITDLISIFNLIREVNWNHNDDKESPIVVHCSAGIGRTGTYITLDAMKDKIEVESKIDIFGFISEIREKRQNLVQNLSQYIYIHDALSEYVLYKFTDIKANEIQETIRLNLKPQEKNLKKIIPINKRKKVKSIAEIEFDKISNRYKTYELIETDSKYYYSSSNNVPSTMSIYYLLPNYKQKLYDAYNSENKPKNRNQNAVCYDFNRVKLTHDEECMSRKNSKTSQRQLSNYKYINATKLKYLKNLDKDFIITQDPLKNTIVDFFSMIIEYDSNIIVSLNCEIEPSCVYWPNQIGQKNTFETDETKFSIEILSKQANNEKTYPLFIEQKIKLTETKVKTGKFKENIVKHFIYNEPWAESKIPANSKGIIDLAVRVQNLSSFSSKPVIVHAHGGASNCSLFSCLCILFNQLFIYEHIDICRLVRIIKPQKQNLFPSFDQYKFLYQAIYDYVNMNGTSFKPMSKYDSFLCDSIASNKGSFHETASDSLEFEKNNVFVEKI